MLTLAEQCLPTAMRINYHIINDYVQCKPKLQSCYENAIDVACQIVVMVIHANAILRSAFHVYSSMSCTIIFVLARSSYVNSTSLLDQV